MFFKDLISFITCMFSCSFINYFNKTHYVLFVMFHVACHIHIRNELVKIYNLIYPFTYFRLILIFSIFGQLELGVN